MLVHALALGLLTSALSAVTPAASTADGVRDLDLTGFSEMVVDREHGRIFISQGNGGVVVLGLDGSRVAALPGLAGAQGLWLDPSGDTLWVAASEAGAVGEVDTVTLQVTTHATGAGSCPHDVASGDGVVWFADDCGASTIAALDPSTGQVTSFPDVAPPTEKREWRLATSPALPGKLFAYSESVRHLVALAATGGGMPALTETARVPWVGWTAGGDDFAITPDGSAIVVAGGEIRRTDTLAQGGNYRHMSSVAIRDDGRVGAVDDGGWRAFDPLPVASAGAERFSFDRGSWRGEWVQSKGVAWGDGVLYAVTRRGTDGQYRLRAAIPKHPSTVRIRTERTSFRYGKRANVTVRLTASSPNRVVALYARPEGEPTVLLARGRVGGEGLVVPYRYLRTTTFTAIYDGDADTYGSWAETTVRVPTQVDLIAKRYRRQLDKTYIYDAGKRAYFLIRVRPTDPSDRVVVFLRARVGGRLVKVGSTRRLQPTSRGVAKVFVRGTGSLVGPDLQIRARWFEGPESSASKQSKRVEFKFKH